MYNKVQDPSKLSVLGRCGKAISIETSRLLRKLAKGIGAVVIKPGKYIFEPTHDLFMTLGTTQSHSTATKTAPSMVSMRIW